ncbi:LOW QUALITY PROTEIN: protein transport protein Sec24B [Rhinatrema bivittatum]|uniref:LOW QUALITY PROTEIN: protein transport protein Sec24B n=1 Tax=Rhinatrema bivittatum TaxID=194408 RepID=UPI0011288E56|nr:LOW QUALITY PROTEIN: protein transport protein Sec24B [Rhinatrema bivittatum]
MSTPTGGGDGSAPGARHFQNGPAQNRIPPLTGYGICPPNYSAQGYYCQAPNKTNPPHSSGYYSANYEMSTPNLVTPAVDPTTLNTQRGPLYNKPPSDPYTMGSAQGLNASYATQLHTGTAQPYSTTSSSHYHTSATHPATSSVGSQGYPLVSSHYTMPTAYSTMYPNVSYPSMPVTNQYEQGFTSQSISAAGQFSDNMLPAQKLVVSQPSQYGAVSWPASGLPPSTNVLDRNSTGSRTLESNQKRADISSHRANQSVDVAKLGTEIAAVPPAGAASVGLSSAVNQAVDSAPIAPHSQQLEPALQEGMLYGGFVNNQASSTPTPLSSSTDDEEEEEDEEAGIESSSTTSSASPVPNSYDSLEGGGYSDILSSPVNSLTPTSSISHAKPFGYGYPLLTPGYQTAAPPVSGTASNNPAGHPGYQQYVQQYPTVNQLSSSLGGLSVQQQPDGLRPINLSQDRNILPSTPVQAPVPNLNSELRKLNCSPDLFRCTLTNVPQTQALLNKAKLPLGLLLHPFRDLTQLPVITSSTIVRCRSCRTYINPFVSFIDQRRWKCNLCYRVNDVPEEFMYNPLTRSYGEPHKRPEVQNSTVEFIASSDYMLRPPQPAVYLFVLDVSHNGVESGYLSIVCQSLLENLDKIPGDSRTKLGFITFDSTVHFYNLQEGLSQPQMLIVSDIDDIFLPTPDSLLVNLHESKELIHDLLSALPNMFINTRETHSSLGPALQAAFKLMSATGGRISVFQTQLPSLGAGHLQSREDPNQRSSTTVVQHLGPATDFYKKLALDCSGQQTAVDLFLLSSQYSDLASLACMSKYSAGCIYYYPSFHHIHSPAQAEKLQKDLKRYFTRKIGFEAVMRIRCTKGLSIHTFHGNFFVRSTDLLSLANINPDAGFAVQMSIEENLADTSLACFQTALLYTSSKGERRIRVHTICLPVVNSLSDVFAGADVQAITCLLANMAVDRSVSSSLPDARDALVNAVIDSLSAYSSTLSNLQQTTVIAPNSLKLFPLFILALLKQKAFRTGTSTRLDDRVYAMCQMKNQPLIHLMKMIHPNLYRIDRLTEESAIHVNDSVVPQPTLQQLSVEKLTREAAFLMDCGSIFYIWVGKNCDNNFIKDVLGSPNYASIPQKMTQLPELDTLLSERTRAFISWLKESRPLNPVLHVIKDDSTAKADFFQHLIEDRTEAAFSYYEFLLHIQQQICRG